MYLSLCSLIEAWHIVMVWGYCFIHSKANARSLRIG